MSSTPIESNLTIIVAANGGDSIAAATTVAAAQQPIDTADAGLPSDTRADEESGNVVGQTITQTEALYDNGRFVDALRFSQQHFGNNLFQWPTARAKVVAARLAGKLGSEPIRRILLRQLGRSSVIDPATLPDLKSFAFSRKPLTETWLSIRDQEIETADPLLQARWVGLKGRVLESLRDFDRAMPLLQEAIDLMPEHPWTHCNFAGALAYQDDIDGAIGVYRDAVALNPNYTMANSALAHYLAQDRKIDEAIDVLTRAIKTNQCGLMRLQLSAMHERIGDYRNASLPLVQIEQYFPLLSAERKGRAKRGSPRSRIAAYRSDSAFELGDIDQAISQARYCNSKFYDKVADSLETRRDTGRRVRLDVPFVRQDDMTCAPATLAMLSKFWGVEVEHQDIASDICYDGTPANKQRQWAIQNNMVVREFTLTVDVSERLLNAGIPFAVSTVEPGSAHIQVVCGYDSRRQTWWIQDPGTWYRNEWGYEKTLRNYAATGPRGFVMVPEPKESLLDAIPLPDADLFDLQHDLSVARDANKRLEAAEILDAMRRTDPNHRVTLWAEVMMARYQMDQVAELTAVKKLAALFPKDESLLLQEMRLQSQLGRSAEVVDKLHAFVKENRVSTETRLRLYHLIKDRFDRSDADRLLRSALCRSGGHPGVLSAAATRLWEQQRYDDSLEVRRLAATADVRDERAASNYLQAAIELAREDEVLGEMRTRFQENKQKSHGPGMTLANALEDCNRIDDSIDVLYQAMQARPEDGELICLAAKMLGRMSDPQSALDLLDQAEVPLPALDEWNARASLCEQLGQMANSLAAYRRLNEICRNDSIVVGHIARLTEQIDGTDAAIDYVAGQADVYPDCGHLLRKLTRLFRRAAKFVDAVATLDKMLTSHPDDAWAWRERSLIHGQCGDFEQAVNDARTGLLHDASADSWSILADALIDVGNVDEAREHYRQAISIDAGYLYAITGLLDVENDLDGRRNALEFIFDSLCSQRCNADGITEYFDLAINVLDDGEMIANLTRIRDHRPELLKTHLLLADAMVRHERSDDAVSCLRVVEDRFQHCPDFWLGLGEAYLSMDRVDEACETMQRGFDLDPNRSDIACRLANTLAKREQSDLGIVVLDRALLSNPRDAMLVFTKGHLVDDDTLAIDCLRKAALLDPEWNSAWIDLREKCRSNGAMEIAVSAAEELIELRPADAYSHFRLALMLVGEEQLERSVDAVRKALTIETRNFDFHRLLVRRLVDWEKYDEALKICDCKDKDPRHELDFEFLACTVLHKMDRAADAVRRLCEAVDRDPSRHKSLLNLADWAEEIDDHASYDRAAEIMIRQFPNWHVGYGYQFETLKRKGKREASIEALTRALECYSDYNWALEQLMQVHLDEGQADAAAKAVREFAGDYSAGLTLSYDLQISVARDDAESFIQSVLACELHGGELRAAVAFARDRFTLQKNPRLQEVLIDRMTDPQADERIGLAWGTLMSLESFFDEALLQLKTVCTSPAWQAAVRELTPAIGDFGEGSDEALSIRKNALARLRKITERHVHDDPNTWASAIWAYLEVKDFGNAGRLASSYEQTQPQYANSLLSAMLASLYDYRVGLLGRISTMARRISHEAIIDEVHVVFAIEAILRRDPQMASRHLSLVGLPGELPDWYHSVYQLITSAMRGVQSGDETELVQCFETRFAGEQAYFVRVLFHRLRCAIAKKHGSWWAYLCVKIDRPWRLN